MQKRTEQIEGEVDVDVDVEALAKQFMKKNAFCYNNNKHFLTLL